MMKIKDAEKLIEDMLKKAGVDSPAFDSLCLTEKVCGCTRTELILNREQPIDKSKAQKLTELAKRRIKGEPLQYILGQWEFFGCTLKVGKGVLIPRDDTEVVLSDCLNYLKGKKGARALDLCSGSGALAIALAKQTGAEVTAVEKSEDALPYLRENAEINNAFIKIVQGDIFQCTDNFPDNYFDLIVSNPPYVKTGEISSLQAEISYEPAMALDGGADGCDFYRHIVKHWSSKLICGGMLALEIGEGQFDAVKRLMTAKGYENIGGSYDLGGALRTIYGTLP